MQNNKKTSEQTSIFCKIPKNEYSGKCNIYKNRALDK